MENGDECFMCHIFVPSDLDPLTFGPQICSPGYFCTVLSFY